MDSRIMDEVSITTLFDQFIEASTMRNVLSIHRRILNYSDLNPCEFNVFFPKLKRAVMTNRVRKNWKAKALFSKIDKKAAHRCYSNTKVPTPIGNRSSDNNQSNSHDSQECLDDSLLSQSSRVYYNNNALQHYNCLIIGSGPAGLRTAIELQLLGASRVVVVEKRSRFSRNNVLHLWPFVIDDLKSLGAKKFYGKFCAGSIDHISIRQLQLILLKICLMIGCDFRDSCSYLYLCPSSIKQTKKITSTNQETNGDSKKANSFSDSSESITLKCDLDVVESSNLSSDFVKVSSSLENEELKNKELNADSQLDTNCDMSAPENGDVEQVGVEANELSSIQSARSTSQTTRIKTPTTDNQEVKSCRTKIEDNLKGTRAHFQSDYKLQETELHSYEWDIIIGADGRRNTLSKFFPRKEFRGRLAIAITANFINRQTPIEASVSEISGLSFIYNQDMFNALAYDTNIQLENICYYKDDTHYFVMTAKKKSLLERGVLINDYAATHDLLSDNNVDRQALFRYAKDAAYWTTGLEPLDFALNHYGQEDCAMFDFTSMYAASNACKALRTEGGGLTLVSLVGDSLLEPFWPTGSGCARGFLSSFDAAWMCRQWAVNKCAVIDYHNPTSSRSSRNRSSTANESNRNIEPTTYNRMALSVIAERESIYRILAQTTSENLQQNYSHWTLNPHSRYPNLNRHLVTPNQVEHLVTDNEARIGSESGDKNKLSSGTSERTRRVKSPNNNSNSRKSPKKLKSANASPLSQPKYSKLRAKSLSKQAYKSRSRNDIDDTYLEFEQSYNNLADCEKDNIPYLNHRRPDCDLFDDFFIPSISGTLPSSNNLLSLEARRARDIDECLRQRRQRTQLSAVRDELVEQFRAKKDSNQPIVPGGAILFNELRRLREQQQSKENKPREVNGSLTLLNSVRRCASFAERVKSFESKLGSSGQESTVTTPKTPIDDVKNLPQFATLQEIFINNSTLNKDNEFAKKPKLPIMKLSKDDWNVKCWEKRLNAYKQKSVKEFGGSTKSLNKAVSIDSYHTIQANKPERQVEVFKNRIKEMANKLKKTRDHNEKPDGEVGKLISQHQDNQNQLKNSNSRSQGWVSHIRRELIKGTETKKSNLMKQPMNPVAPNKPIRKLFEDDDEDEDGLDMNKHYDHLCVNRPVNKYLSKNGYTSHLTRVKYNSNTSRVINREIGIGAKQAYLSTLTSRGSSASSTISDQSTNTNGSSSGSTQQQQPETVKCYRCKERLNSVDMITICDFALHRQCLTCSDCGITLRTNEMQHYLSLLEDSPDSDGTTNFLCSICKPSIRLALNKEATERLNNQNDNTTNISSNYVQKPRLKSREEFLNERINYNELYKNILDDNMRSSEAMNKIEHLRTSSSRETTPTVSVALSKQSSSSQDYEDALSKQDSASISRDLPTISPSPVTITLPLTLATCSQQKCSLNSDVESNELGSAKSCGYRIARSETINGSEQVTLILPSSNNGSQRAMIDEEELQRILHLDQSGSRKSRNSSSLNNKSSFSDESSGENKGAESSEHGDDSSDENREDEDPKAGELSDDPSSLNSPPNTEDFDDEDDEDDEIDGVVDQNSTYEDFLTSEEFGAISDREEDEALSESRDVEQEAPQVGVVTD